MMFPRRFCLVFKLQSATSLEAINDHPSPDHTNSDIGHRRYQCGGDERPEHQRFPDSDETARYPVPGQVNIERLGRRL